MEKKGGEKPQIPYDSIGETQSTSKSVRLITKPVHRPFLRKRGIKLEKVLVKIELKEKQRLCSRSKRGDGKIALSGRGGGIEKENSKGSHYSVVEQREGSPFH